MLHSLLFQHIFLSTTFLHPLQPETLFLLILTCLIAFISHGRLVRTIVLFTTPLTNPQKLLSMASVSFCPFHSHAFPYDSSTWLSFEMASLTSVSSSLAPTRSTIKVTSQTARLAWVLLEAFLLLQLPCYPTMVASFRAEPSEFFASLMFEVSSH